MGPRLAVDTPCCYNNHQRRQPDYGCCHLLGELHALTPLLSLQPERQFVPRPDRRSKRHLAATHAHHRLRKQGVRVECKPVCQKKAPARMDRRQK